MISMVTIILAMITSTALNAFLNGWQRAAKQKGCENGKAFCGEMTSMGVHLVVWRGLLRKEGVKNYTLYWSAFCAALR